MIVSGDSLLFTRPAVQQKSPSQKYRKCKCKLSSGYRSLVLLQMYESVFKTKSITESIVAKLQGYY